MSDIIFGSTIGDTLTIASMLGSLFAALGLGLFISAMYLVTHRGESYSSSFVITLIMLPAIISVIILLIGNNVARAFSLAGAFSLVRFRSAPGDPKDIAYVFFTLGVGLGCGLGYLAYSAVFAVVLCLMMLLLTKVRFARQKSDPMQLKITIPENMNYSGLFDDILNKSTEKWTLRKVKTSDFGTLFELVYSIRLRKDADQKSFLDELRCRNGNLNISLTLQENDENGG
ncbi:MAG TPA: DUF4956 domain-containing protein [Clostridiales bacterium]|nr:DUF4956 domain-containing protein [Clostridiales bacterium]HQH62783.1 DUF4956 domain-containing protein [Clostridiales bacterium]